MSPHPVRRRTTVALLGAGMVKCKGHPMVLK
jgi:hypothetical protein